MEQLRNKKGGGDAIIDMIKIDPEKQKYISLIQKLNQGTT